MALSIERLMLCTDVCLQQILQAQRLWLSFRFDHDGSKTNKGINNGSYMSHITPSYHSLTVQ